MRILKLNAENRKFLRQTLEKRGSGDNGEYEARVREIIEAVRKNGDEAICAYTKAFDSFDLTRDSLPVGQEEIRAAYAELDEDYIQVIRNAAENIREFHQKQKRNSWLDTQKEGVLLGMKITAMERAGVYVPGGKAAYPSSVLMNVIPAKVAGVDRIIMTTPPDQYGKINAGTLVAAHIAGVDEIYRVGGAQAIAAMAFGTATIPKVDKITGPGNIYVALAKKEVYGHTSIDSIAGPSEILVLADETANPRYAAADLLSQAEHDELASAVMITTSERVARETARWAEYFADRLERKAIIRRSLESFGFILLAENMEEAIEAANEIASEHLEILTANPFETMTHIRHAGAIFLGEYASEPLGDYFAGPNHILPTNGTARFFSPVSVDDFIKKTSIISYSREALEAAAPQVALFASREGLTAHANSIRVRFEDEPV